MKFDFAMLERHVADLKARHRYDEAEALLRPFVRSGMRAPIPVWKLLVGVLRQQGKIEETRRIQEMLVAATPDDFAAHSDLAETLLLQGDFERGWREYRYRYSLPHATHARVTVQRPRWEGQPISGETLLIHDEQNRGDTLQFLRMVPWARERSGARLILQIEAELLPLAARAGGFDEIVPSESPAPPFDLHCEMMSLPVALKLRLENLPGPVPYLRADPELARHWRERLLERPRPWVGLNWPAAPSPSSNITIVPLDESRPLEDSAALISVLDLVISTDCALVHLAGALGKPVWALLPFIHDWRWLLSRTDTPWYPTVRLFRQPAPRDWGSVVDEVGAELEKFRASS